MKTGDSYSGLSNPQWQDTTPKVPSRPLPRRNIITTVVVCLPLVLLACNGRKHRCHERLQAAALFLSEIRLAQQRFFETHGQFADTTASRNCTFVDNDLCSFNAVTEDLPKALGHLDQTDCELRWRALGIKPTGVAAAYDYVVVGWRSDLHCVPPKEHIVHQDGRWWYVVARTDCDDDGEFSTVHYSSEMTTFALRGDPE